MNIAFQNIVVALIFLGAVFFLARKFFGNKKDKAQGCASDSCGCGSK